MYKCRVVTEKCNGGWRVRIVGGDWLTAGRVMETDSLFGLGPARVFPTREAARQDIRRYAKKFSYVKITGGLH